MVLTNVSLKKDVVALVFSKDVCMFTSVTGSQEHKVTLSLYEPFNADVSEIQFYSVVYPSGETAVFEILDGVIYNDLAFQTDYENGDVDALQVERGDFAVFTTTYGDYYGKVHFSVSDLLDYSFGRYTDSFNASDYLIDNYVEGE